MERFLINFFEYGAIGLVMSILVVLASGRKSKKGADNGKDVH